MASIRAVMSAIEKFNSQSNAGYSELLAMANEILAQTERLCMEVKADKETIDNQICRASAIRDEVSQKASFYEHQMNGYYSDMKRAEEEIEYIMSHPKTRTVTDDDGDSYEVEEIDYGALAAAERRYESAKESYYHFANKYQEAATIAADAVQVIAKFESMGKAVAYVADSIEAATYEIRKFIRLMEEEAEYNLQALSALISRLGEYLSSKPIFHPTGSISLSASGGASGGASVGSSSSVGYSAGGSSASSSSGVTSGAAAIGGSGYAVEKTNSAPEGTFNVNAKDDIERAYQLMDLKFEKDSAEWQEIANRKSEIHQSIVDSLTPKYEELCDRRTSIENQKSNYVMNNNLDFQSCETDEGYQTLLKEYLSVNEEAERLKLQINSNKSQIQMLLPYINEGAKTTFKGFGGSDFENAYNGYNTARQGYADSNFTGVCGINGSATIVNQQTGSRIDEGEALRDFVNRRNPWCETRSKNPSNNGGTTQRNREEYLNSKGLSFEAVSGSYKGKGETLTLEAMAERFFGGESIGLVLKAEDLRETGIANRNINLFDYKTWSSTNRLYSNHMTTIAGFSYDSNNKITGVWINDTGGWVHDSVGRCSTNRVFLSAEKFYAMQNNTLGFQAEFSKYVGEQQ